MASTNTWNADVKQPEGPIDPNVLPEYTLLPTSPPQSVVSYNDPDAASDVGSSASARDTTTAPAAPQTCGTESLNIFKLLYTGMLAIVLPPTIIAGAALAAAGVMLYGCGKMLEGVGRGVAFVPEAVYRACVAKRVRKVSRAFAFRERRQVGGERAQQEPEEVVEGQVVLEDVEAGQVAGPISI